MDQPSPAIVKVITRLLLLSTHGDCGVTVFSDHAVIFKDACDAIGIETPMKDERTVDLKKLRALCYGVLKVPPGPRVTFPNNAA